MLAVLVAAVVALTVAPATAGGTTPAPSTAPPVSSSVPPPTPEEALRNVLRFLEGDGSPLPTDPEPTTPEVPAGPDQAPGATAEDALDQILRRALDPAAPPGNKPGPPSTQAAPSAQAQRPPAAPPQRGVTPAVTVLGALGLGAVLAAALTLQRRRRRGHHDRSRLCAGRRRRERRVHASGGGGHRAVGVVAEEAAEWVDAANRALAAGVAGRAGDARPEVVCVRAGELGVEILLAAPSARAPRGFVAADGGHVWRVEAGLDLAELISLGGGHAPACPALVTLGASPEGPVLGDVAAVGLLSAEGDRALVAAFLAGAAQELGAAPWAADLDVRVVGAVGGDFTEGPPVGADPAAVAAELEAVAAATTETTRLEGGGADRPPTVVVAGDGVPAAELERLVALATAESPTVALAAAGPVAAARWRLVIDADATATLEPLGLGLRVSGVGHGAEPAPYSPPHPSSPEAATASLEPAGPPVPAAALPLPGAGLAGPDSFPVWVAVLGPVEVRGWARPPRPRRKLTELVVYLATHPEHPVPGDVLRCACWAEREVAYRTFTETMSRLRRHLGTDEAGQTHLPPAHDGTYRLGPAVGCDWTCFRRLVGVAATAPPAEAASAYGQALSLVRGEPFASEARGAYSWVWKEQLVYEMQAAIVDAALRLGELALEAGDHATARWAAARGRLVSANEPSLFDLELRAATAAGDAGAVARLSAATTVARRVVEATEAVPPVSARGER